LKQKTGTNYCCALKHKSVMQQMGVCEKQLPMLSYI